MTDNSIDLPFGDSQPAPREEPAPITAPLAVRMRPRSLSEVVGHAHILGEGCLLPRLVATNSFGSLIFYGPRGAERPLSPM